MFQFFRLVDRMVGKLGQTKLGRALQTHDRMRFIITIVGTTFLIGAQGCAYQTKAGRKTAVAAGTGIAVAGLLMFAAMSTEDVDSDFDGVNESSLNDGCSILGNGVGCVLSLGLVFGGGGLAIGSLAAPVAEDKQPTAEGPPPVAFPQAVESPRAGSADKPARASLPELPVDPMTLRLAQQARSQVEQGDCTIARATLAEIARRDLQYHRALHDGNLLDGCR